MTTTDLWIGRTQLDVAGILCRSIVENAHTALQARGRFTVALSGGSLISLLGRLPLAFSQVNVDPQWSNWHVFLADERCVPLDSTDSNLGSLQTALLHATEIPPSQVHGINQELLSSRDGMPMPDKVQAIAQQYEVALRQVLGSSGFLDLSVLGFGPDGHTCSLFPNHNVLGSTKWVAGVTDSPKPPLCRITFTFELLNHHTRHVIVCGTGTSKQAIVEQMLDAHRILPLHTTLADSDPNISVYSATLRTPPKFPIAMVHSIQSLTWILDQDAVPSRMGLLSTVVAEVSVSKTKHEVAQDLCRRVVELCHDAIQSRGWFSVAMSGGSLPDLLSNLPQAFRDAQVDPKYHRWLVLLADERGVPESHSDSNMRAIRRALLNKISVPAQQVYGINVISLSESIDVAAQSYQTQLLSALSKTDDRLDLALLGFGPDGHTCSLFPNHLSLLQSTKLVMGVTNSPKPPSHRITLTLKTLNERTQNIIVCGTGESKSLVLQEILQGTYRDGHSKTYAHVYPKYPCGMLRPKLQLVYICDEQALKGVYVASSQHGADHDVTVNTGSHILARRGTSFLIKVPTAKIHVRDSKETLRQELYSQIIRCATVAIAERGAFAIALSGGSLPWLLSKLPRAFEEAGVNPCWHRWHILLADERCVPADHVDSNMHDIQKYLLADLYGQIVLGNIYGLDNVSLAESTDIVAQDYQRKLLSALTHSGGMLDLAVLGMGADGHTCSLFPGHVVLTSTRWVAPVTDSPKEPSHRITMTVTFLNHHTRNVLFVGMGEAKSGILKETLPLLRSQGLFFESEVDSIYPCGMIRPQDDLVYLVDAAAVSQCVVAPIDGTALQYASVLVTPTKDDIPERLHRVLIRESQKAIRLRGCFTVALSGGSLPSFLSGLDISFQHVCVDPQWDKWNVLLADERCVPTAHDDSNMGALTKELLHHIGIPSAQLYGIDESLLEAPAGIQAQAYESKLRSALSKSGGMLDLALLGFGPDGHTCSLFPGHALLQERYRWISGLENSPKPPPKRVTLTLRVLNEYTRIVVFCGAGSSKRNVLDRVFGVVEGRHGSDFHVCMNIGELPCSMVRPRDELYWIVDHDAMPTNMNMIASPSLRISTS